MIIPTVHVIFNIAHDPYIFNFFCLSTQSRTSFVIQKPAYMHYITQDKQEGSSLQAFSTPWSRH